mgnify:FL=1|tara:strand:- start:1289 stop:1489 length:201 start_codon:yes stop_codon:yes gene_type:complete
MTEKQIVEYFEDYILPGIKEVYEQDNIIDGPARREAFNNMVDSLVKNNEITEELANVICLPDNLDA